MNHSISCSDSLYGCCHPESNKKKKSHRPLVVLAQWHVIAYETFVCVTDWKSWLTNSPRDRSGAQLYNQSKLFSSCSKSHVWLLLYAWDVYMVYLYACSVCLKGRQFRKEFDPTAQRGPGYMGGCLPLHAILFIYLFLCVKTDLGWFKIASACFNACNAVSDDLGIWQYMPNKYIQLEIISLVSNGL